MKYIYGFVTTEGERIILTVGSNPWFEKMFKKHHEERKMKFKDKFDVQLFLWIGLACFNLPEQKIWNFELENLRTSF